MPATFRVDSLLSARLFLSPQRVGERLYFLSNLSGRISLYAMDAQGSVPEPLLPPELALQNPVLLSGLPFQVMPGAGRIVIALDRDGDEHYQPMWIPLEGGIPQPLLEGQLARHRVHLRHCDPERQVAWLVAESLGARETSVFRADLQQGRLEHIYTSPDLPDVLGAAPDHERAVLVESYTLCDSVLYLWEREGGLRRLLGTPLGERAPADPTFAVRSAAFSAAGEGLLLVTSLHDDRFGVSWLDLGSPGRARAVSIAGPWPRLPGELKSLERIADGRYLLHANLDGVSYLGEGRFDAEELVFTVQSLLAGGDALAGGVVQSCRHDRASESFAVSFSSAVQPATLVLIEKDGEQRSLTRERVLGIPERLLSRGEEAGFVAEDGLRIAARLYRPSPELGFTGDRPLVYYLHGGPQSQERPDFTWFSMPLIQLLTLGGFAVFVPNARGSTGYGIDYMRRVDRDWGGLDRLDHVRAMQLLSALPGVDAARAGVIGRSYGGYMTLTLAARHPGLFRAAIDMFGPADLLTFLERLPPSWKPYMDRALGHPERDREFLIERSPRTWLEGLACPLLVIQGRNDPRVVEAESSELVAGLRARGKQVEYLLFEDEGHDVLKHANRVRCYTAIRDFFSRYLSDDPPSSSDSRSSQP